LAGVVDFAFTPPGVRTCTRFFPTDLIFTGILINSRAVAVIRPPHLAGDQLLLETPEPAHYLRQPGRAEAAGVRPVLPTVALSRLVVDRHRRERRGNNETHRSRWCPDKSTIRVKLPAVLFENPGAHLAVAFG
jgi:hypothetical protein